jgi:hypothetical protein
MTNHGSSRPDVDTSRVAYGTEPDPTAWTGWVVFASFMMILLGCFQAIEGLVALFDAGFYLVTSGGLVVDVNYNVWGTVHLLLGILLLASGVGVLTWRLAWSASSWPGSARWRTWPSSGPTQSGASSSSPSTSS